MLGSPSYGIISILASDDPVGAFGKAIPCSYDYFQVFILSIISCVCSQNLPHCEIIIFRGGSIFVDFDEPVSKEFTSLTNNDVFKRNWNKFL